MTFEELKQFMKNLGWGMLATSDGTKVGVRPMGGLTWKDKTLLCATFAASDKVAQLKNIPYAEYCFCNPEGRHVRIAGPCTIVTDNDIKKWLYGEVPALKNYISDPASSEYVIIKMAPDNVRYMKSDGLGYEQVGI